MSTLQERLDGYFDAYLRKEMSIEIYLQKMTGLEKHFTEEVKKEFGYRKDNRSLAEFAKHMIEQMEIEQDVIEHWVKNFGYDLFHKKATFEYSGISEDARLICQSSSTKDDIKRPDVVINRAGFKRYLEIKQCPVLYKATYKTGDLKHYDSLGNVYVLTAHTKGKFSADKVSFYTLLTPENLSRLVADGKSGKLNVQKRREMGYKNAVQFDRAGLEEYFEIQET
tara:strand:+ start:1987 stop:2658 length:672 start_codon:yes stop_codon:yes gene_type:complete